MSRGRPVDAQTLQRLRKVERVDGDDEHTSAM